MKLEKLREVEAQLERSLESVREAMREEINRGNLNKTGSTIRVDVKNQKSEG